MVCISFKNRNKKICRKRTSYVESETNKNQFSKISEYMMKVLGQDMRNIISADPSILQRHSSASSPSAEKLIKTDHRINLWNMCHNNNNNSNVLQSAKIHSPHSPPAIHSPLTSTESPEPQREALDLASATIK
jgi:hypothetical protein